jgi:hypothetical protein
MMPEWLLTHLSVPNGGKVLTHHESCVWLPLPSHPCWKGPISHALHDLNDDPIFARALSFLDIKSERYNIRVAWKNFLPSHRTLIANSVKPT